ncbi:TetR/AcrR family transcriptional regulator C-terminal domain-containing protein [Streptomyces sp. NPDC058377]|uniref:TetR/AcrR family transcriptional regulator C-terminal domain-containing protein n=1 Tax=Streptomyces sp. NPDC058377 TaxID=3346468 RepID=UPI00365D4EC2
MTEGRSGRRAGRRAGRTTADGPAAGRPHKDELLGLTADRVCRLAYDAGTEALAALPPAAPWQDRVATQTSALRLSIKEHPGGAQLLAESAGTLSTGALSLMERLLRTLLDAGLPAGHCAVADTLLSHVTGFVLQEQNQADEPPPVTAERYAELCERFPLLMGPSMPRLSQDEKFTRSLRLLCAGFATPA